MLEIICIRNIIQQLWLFNVILVQKVLQQIFIFIAKTSKIFKKNMKSSVLYLFNIKGYST